MTTINDLWEAYRRSNERRLAPSSIHTYEKALRTATAMLPTTVVEDITRRDMMYLRDALADRPGLGNLCLSLLSMLMREAEARGVIPRSPVAGVQRFPMGSYEPWSVEDLSKIKLMTGRSRRLAILCLHTAQRFCDVATLRWRSVIFDSAKGIPIAISFQQQKTGTQLCVPCDNVLSREMTKWLRQDGMAAIRNNWLVAASCRHASVEAQRGGLRRQMVKLGINGVIHGLRCSALTRFAEAGCTPHEIMAISGHKTLKMVMPYTRRAEQRKLAAAALQKLQNGDRGAGE